MGHTEVRHGVFRDVLWRRGNRASLTLQTVHDVKDIAKDRQGHWGLFNQVNAAAWFRRYLIIVDWILWRRKSQLMTNEENIKDNALISPSVSLQYVIWEIE
jgi:hypothetical protein